MTRRSNLLSAFAVLVLIVSVTGTFAQQPAPAGRGAAGGRGGAAGGRGAGGQPITMVFKETWKDTSTMAVMTQDFVTNPDLELKIYGTGKTDFSVTNEGGIPHIWTGDCASSCALALRLKDNFVDLTGKAKIRWKTKTSGFHEIRPVLKLADGTYLVGDHVDAGTVDYRESEFYISEVRWLKVDITKVQTKGTLLDTVDLSKVDEIGFADLTPGSGHGTGGYSDVGWIEVYGKAVKRDAAK